MRRIWKKAIAVMLAITVSTSSISVMGSNNSLVAMTTNNAPDYYENDTIAMKLYFETEEVKPKEDILITNPVKQLYVGDTFRYVILIKEWQPEWYRWKTSDSSIAVINERTGELTAKKAGKVTVTVTSKRKGKTASYTLQIVEKEKKSPEQQKKDNEDTLYIQEGTKEMMASDFNNWKNLKYVVIPASVEELYQENYMESENGERTPLKDVTNGGAFRGNEKIEAYYVDGNNRNFFSLDGVLYRGDLQKDFVRDEDNITQDKTLYRYPVAKKNKIFEIPLFVSRIDEYAFAGAKNLTEVYTNFVNETDTEIGAYAFYGCKNLKLLEIDVLKNKRQSKEQLYEVIGNFNKENYKENGITAFETIQRTKLPFVSAGVKKKVYLYQPDVTIGRLVKEVYGVNYRTTEESAVGKESLEMEYPGTYANTIGIGDSLYGEPYRLVAQGFHPNATYSYTVKDKSILSVKTKGAYGYLTGKKVGTTTVTCKQTYKGNTTTVGTLKVTVADLISKDVLQQKKAWGIGTYRKQIIAYPTVGADYIFEVDKEGLSIKQDTDRNNSPYVGASQIVTATKQGTYQVKIKEKLNGKTKTIGTYTIKIAKNPNNYKTKKEVTYALGQRIEGYQLVEDQIEPTTFLLKYDEDYFISYKEMVKDSDLIPIKEGDTVVEVYEYINHVGATEKAVRKIGEVTVHIEAKELTTFQAKVDEIPMYVGQTLPWYSLSDDIRQYLEIDPGYEGETEYALFDMEADDKEMLSFQRNGNAGMDMTALKAGTTKLTITANSKKVDLKVLVFDTEEECYEYIDSKK